MADLSVCYVHDFIPVSAGVFGFDYKIEEYDEEEDRLSLARAKPELEDKLATEDTSEFFQGCVIKHGAPWTGAAELVEWPGCDTGFDKKTALEKIAYRWPKLTLTAFIDYFIKLERTFAAPNGAAFTVADMMAIIGRFNDEFQKMTCVKDDKTTFSCLGLTPIEGCNFCFDFEMVM